MRMLKEIALELLDKYEDAEMGCISEGISILDDMYELGDECKRYREEIEAADVVEVVRCKDCRWHDEHYCNGYKALDYCSFGWRKEIEDE